MTAEEKRRKIGDESWQGANQAWLAVQMQRLRLLLQRRVLWLRHQWEHDPLQNYQGMLITDAQADRLMAGDDPQAEARFYREEKNAAAIRRSIAAVDRELGGLTEALIEAGKLPALEGLVHLFGLTPFERNVLLLCFTPEWDPRFEQLYAYVQDEVTRKYATPHLALTLFVDLAPSPEPGGVEEDLAAARNSFLPEAPLRRFRLVTLEPGLFSATASAARPLRLDERIADYLRGINRPDERIADLLRPMPPALPAPVHQDLVDRLTGFFESEAFQGPWPVLNLIGPSDVGKRAVARELCDGLGLEIYGLDVKRLAADGHEVQETMRLLEREALLSQFSFYLDTNELDPNDKALRDVISGLIERLGVFLIVGGRQGCQTEREILAVHVSKLDARAQNLLWHKALTDLSHALNGHIDAIVQQFDFGPHAISQVVAAAKNRARLRVAHEDVRLTSEDLWEACREQAGWHLNELAQPIIPCYTWEDIILPEDVLRQLREIAAQAADRHIVYEVWGFGRKLSRGRSINALFSGPSGTGKTMAAEVLADHLKLDLYRIDLAGVVSKYIGETEKNLGKVFDAAEQSGAILFFDEADALFGKRTEVKDSHDRYANIEVNYLLQRMEDYRGLAILATNRKSLLDQAFLRRLRFLVDFPFPDVGSRRRIWQKVFPAEAPANGIDYDQLARLEIPGGNIRNIALSAAFLAAGEGLEIGTAHIIHATRREYAKIDKLVTEGEFGPYYHQAGG